MAVRLNLRVHGHPISIGTLDFLWCALHGARLETLEAAQAALLGLWLERNITADASMHPEQVLAAVRSAIDGSRRPICCLLGERTVKAAIKRDPTNAPA